MISCDAGTVNNILSNSPNLVLALADEGYISIALRCIPESANTSGEILNAEGIA
jgi:hypothetical protein